MLTYEQDPDVVRWGLELFEGDPYLNCGYSGSVNQDGMHYYQGQYFKEDVYDTNCPNVEYDELIAHHALQEELSLLDIEEEPEISAEQVEHLQASVFPQDWSQQSIGNYGSGQEIVQGEADEVGPSSSCSSPDEKTYYGDDWSYSLELANEYTFDGERLNQMVPVPHVPKINGDIPSLDQATLDHQRLLDRLQLYGLVENKVQGDGNCQFRALADQFYRSPEHHEFVRQQIVNQLKSYPEIYEGYVPMAYDDYLEKMSRSGEWGDHVTLQAAADLYGVKIFVITSFKDTCYIEILPNTERSKRVICLSFWAEVHYNSIYSEGDVPTFETKKKKKRGMSRKHLESTSKYQ
ncbi:OVARIAN TUMOR DOMAIN-containing deubiquitinating enzyme 12-like [Argentina anserina]|uniref:OVARIAN TUMOR DOMAIN-containing deubiquitinating enzyme 12-like n=1 Tax=Argentina anserina TaxID=57926 RepID=UPI0021768CE4|nr:OVARIAN TUMOR DOMAIN-containing deubiquitinating enzyme 12-like [Potentilla anserina]